jgi:hypothetical protein
MAYANFFWAGNELNKKQLENLKKWQKSCEGTEFKVQVTFSHELMEELKKSQKVIFNSDLNQYQIPPEGILVRDLDDLLEKYKEKYPLGIAFYRKNIEHKNYAFASDFSRLLILNENPGFYFDLDFTPNGQLPSSLHALKDQIQETKFDLDYYVNPIETSCMENSFLVTLKSEMMNGLLNEFESFLGENSTKFLAELKEFDEYKNHSRVKKLKESIFISSSDFPYMKAYVNNDASTFRSLLKKERGEGINQEWGLDAPHQFKILEGLYILTIEKFLKNSESILNTIVPLGSKEPGKEFLRKYQSFFAKVMGQYFKSDQNKLPLYNWGNPGFQRLTFLKEVIGTIERITKTKFSSNEKKTKISVDSLLEVCTKMKEKFTHAEKYIDDINQFSSELQKKYDKKIWLSATEIKNEIGRLIKITKNNYGDDFVELELPKRLLFTLYLRESITQHLPSREKFDKLCDDTWNGELIIDLLNDLEGWVNTKNSTEFKIKCKTEITDKPVENDENSPKFFLK